MKYTITTSASIHNMNSTRVPVSSYTLSLEAVNICKRKRWNRSILW